MQIKQNSVVHIHYTLTNDAGEVVDSSVGKEPLMYMQGHQNIIPGLENALLGKSVGEQLKVSIEPEDAYGVRNDDAIQQVPREAFANVPDLAVGMQLHGNSPQGPISVVVMAIAEDVVTVDANHPLAGQRLHFDVTVDAVRDATESELSHGHAHAGDGHHH
ncbi:FKBP-type peptidyl-prolyl cis-trans isomerase [Hydromonas duriensis]|uniref:Peptidyl-prolyl cis-trans isomerase n=1 Tax=Hydromonas duriensis TaxID=1527608 RepID=A0A4R6XZV3_9BURK|nr:peptidylprolyl isomerase [Hydromonas duriensis]TDR27717.1 FKBP-type peptidyl-prolyl cis-trans isomerase SlyD [Hydromonas duriensis]